MGISPQRVDLENNENVEIQVGEVQVERNVMSLSTPVIDQLGLVCVSGTDSSSVKAILSPSKTNL